MQTTKINITDIFEYNSITVYELVFVKADNDYEIIIFREYIAGENDNNCIATEYIKVSHAGQCLAEIADSFAYFVPGELTKKPFLFEITVTDFEKFADSLYFIIQGFNFYHNEEAFVSFQVLAADFLTDAYDDKFECHTWGFFNLQTGIKVNKNWGGLSFDFLSEPTGKFRLFRG